MKVFRNTIITLAVAFAGAQLGAADERPNILFFLCDDLGYGDVGVFYQNSRGENEPSMATPHIDKLANEGIQLRAHYVGAPVCAPSRATLFLGQSQGNSPVRNNQFDKALPDQPSLASTLKEAGYHTALIGKWGLQGNKEKGKEGADAWPSYPTKRGFDYFLGYVTHVDGHEHYPFENIHFKNKAKQTADKSNDIGTAASFIRAQGFWLFLIPLFLISWAIWHKRKTQGEGSSLPSIGIMSLGLIMTLILIISFFGFEKGKPHRKAKLWEQKSEISDQLKGCYTTDLFTAATKRFLISHTKEKKDKPFFVMLSYDTPHAATQIATMPYPSGYGVNGGLQWLGEKGKMINTTNASTDSYIHPDYKAKGWKDVYKRYASSVRRIDNSVADVMQTLKDLDLDENTLVIFSSDHGPSKESYISEPFKSDFFRSFGPFTGVKRDCWEGGIRPGAIVRWPAKVDAGSVTESPSQMQDWMPTFCEVAGAPIPAIADGTSLVPQITGKVASDPTQGSEIYVEYYQKKKTPDFKHFAADRVGQKRGEMQSIRQGKYKAIRYNVKKKNDLFMVFDLTKDPSESTNIAGQDGVPNQQHWLAAVSRHHHRNPSAKRPYDNAPIASIKVVDAKLKQGVTEVLAKENSASYLSRDSYQQRGFIKVETAGRYKFNLPKGMKGLLRMHYINVLDRDSKQPYPNNNTLNLKAGMHPFTLYLAEKPVDSQIIQWKKVGSKEGFKAVAKEDYFHH